MIDQELIGKLRQKLQEKRRYGVVHLNAIDISLFNKGNDKATIDSYVAFLGFHPLGNEWLMIKSRLVHIINCLHFSIPFHDIVMPYDEATTLAEEIRGLFSESKRYYTHHSKYGDDGLALSPLTDATFNTGIVFIDDDQIGIFWVDDED